MPQIPQFTGKRELSVESPNVKVNASDFGVKGKVGAEGEALSKVGNTLMQIGEKFQEIKDENEFTSAQVNTQKRLNDLYIKKQNDPDIWGAGDKLQEEIDKIHTEESEKIGNQLVKNRFSADFQMRAMSYTNKIQDDLRQKQHESMSANAMDFINGEKENYYNAGTPADRALAMENINIKINEMSGRGIWNAQATQKFREEIKTEMNVGLATSDMNLDPKSALIELKKGKEGAYPDIPHDQRLKLIDMAENQILKDEKIAERNLIIAKNQTESDNLDAYREILQAPEGVQQNKMVTDLVDKLNKEADAKLIDSKFAVGMIKALMAPTVVSNPTEAEQASSYIELSNRTAEIVEKKGKATLEEINQLRFDGIKAVSKKLITTANFAKMIGETKELFDARFKGTENNFRKKYDQSTFAAINNWVNKYGDRAYQNEIKARMYMEYKSRIDNGENSQDALWETIHGEQKPSSYKIGDIVTNPRTGESAKVTGFDDGNKPILERQ